MFCNSSSTKTVAQLKTRLFGTNRRGDCLRPNGTLRKSKTRLRLNYCGRRCLVLASNGASDRRLLQVRRSNGLCVTKQKRFLPAAGRLQRRESLVAGIPVRPLRLTSCGCTLVYSAHPRTSSINTHKQTAPCQCWLMCLCVNNAFFVAIGGENASKYPEQISKAHSFPGIRRSGSRVLGFQWERQSRRWGGDAIGTPACHRTGFLSTPPGDSTSQKQLETSFHQSCHNCYEKQMSSSQDVFRRVRGRNGDENLTTEKNTAPEN